MAGLMKGTTGRVILALIFIAFGAGFSTRAYTQGAYDYPIPSRAKEAYSPIREGFESPIEPRERLRGPKAYIDTRGPALRRYERVPEALAFFRDTKLKANSRTYWFGEDSFGFDKPQALTTGGSLSYQSGYIADFFQLRSVLYTTQPLYANAEAGKTLNLSPQGDEITTFGQVNGRMKYAGHELTAGRQLIRTPYINPYDVRMIPLTVEGVVLLPEHKVEQKIDYTTAYLWRYKPRNSGSFIPFSEGVGVEQNEGVLVTGASYHTDSWNYGFSNYWIKDTLNTLYGEVDYLLPLGSGGDDDGPSLRIGVNHLDQRTVGADLIAGAPYNTYQASARVVASYMNFVLIGAVSKVGDEASIEKPFGFSTSHTAMMITNFHQASVQAYLLQLSYDFEKLGLEGVKFHVAWGKGEGKADQATNGGFADQEELDLRFVYEPHRGKLQGLRVELEYVDWQVFDQDFPSDALTEFRAIVNYSVPLL